MGAFPASADAAYGPMFERGIVFIPKKVQTLVAEIRENTGVEPIVTRVNDRRYRVTVASDRVFCTVDYKFTGNRWEWAASTLTVDGERMPIMPTPAAFYRLFQNPDTQGLEPADLSILDELKPMKSAPMLILLEHLQSRLSLIDSSTIVEPYEYQGIPAVLVKMPRANMLWLLRDQSVELKLFTLDGLDYTNRFAHLPDLEEMFEFLAESHGVTLPSRTTNTFAPKQFGSNPATMSNAVRTRKQSVIRT